MLEKDIKERLTQAMKSGDKIQVSELRMLISELKNKKIADGVKELDDEKVISVIQKIARKHKESIAQFKQGNRNDLVDKESEELAVLEEYLPEQLSEEEIEKIVSEVIQEVGATSPKDMGKLMSALMPRLKGCADGRVVNEIVKKKLK
jgi:uncharacterized protein